MPVAHQYHQPNAPDPADDDAESDLDLDLQELDPAASTQGGTFSATGPSFGGQIPLRTLRVGRSRGNRRYAELERRRDADADADADADDLEALISDADGHKEDSGGRAGAGAGDADEPLLQPHYGRRRPHRRESTLSRLSTTLRLTSFISPSLYPSEPDQPPAGSEPDADHDPTSNRTIAVGLPQPSRFPPNAVSNAKYTPWSFLPLTLYNEFSFFFNLYFLLVALSQIIPALRIGYLTTYIAPLAFVLAITLGKEAIDDVARRRRDAEANSEAYTVLKFEENSLSSRGKNGKGIGKPKKIWKGKKAANGTASRLTDIEDEEQNTQSGGEGEPTATVREITKRSSELRVGDVLKLGKNQRVPADVVLLKSTSGDLAAVERVPNQQEDPSQMTEVLVEAAAQPSLGVSTVVEDEVDPNNSISTGEAFIRTDQLDGETDWKLRLASPLTQALDLREITRLRVMAGKPDKKVNEFVGTVELLPKPQRGYDPPIDKSTQTEGVSLGSQKQAQSAPLTVDNTAWANTVLASSSTVLAVVVYTGPQTRQALSTSPSRSKTGLLEYEINSLTKILCFLTLALSFILVAFEGFEGREGKKWYIDVMRFLILFSTIVPISLRVNLDMGKSVYAYFIEHDQGIPGTVVRTSTIPEDLGRIEYLLSDKTGTLTQNEMELKKIHVGTVSYAGEAMDEVSSYIRQAFSAQCTSDSTEATTLINPSSTYLTPSASAARTRREIGARVRDVVLALALCHNVTPTTEEENGHAVTTYQASSPDEIAIVRWAEDVGLRLSHRDRNFMALQSVHTGKVVVRVRILNVFPFTSEGKRMGIVVRFLQGTDAPPQSDDDGEVWFFQKGADTVMASIVAANDWLDEETANMAREGLRTLVVGRKKLSSQQYQDFSSSYGQASLSLQGRDAAMAGVVKDFLERDLELLGVTGVEDKLQRDVKPSLELLRNAGVKIWMLTGDKIETARCVAISSKLVARGQYIHTIAKLRRKDLAPSSLDFLRTNPTSALLIDGDSLSLMLSPPLRDDFISLAVQLPAVIACRCSPTQKADMARLIRAHTKKRVCCIGDGGNDVSMIQAADVGVGIVGKEGKQASLAADFSVTEFKSLCKLLVWHGRNSYKRSAKLAQFVIHRGLIISVCQTVYSIASRFEPIALYRDWLLVGYATLYTAFPVFSLVLDRDVDESLANLYPELYKELTTGRSLSYRTFFIWVAVSIYQGCVIQGLSQLLVGLDDFPKMVAVSFTVLVINELVMVAAEVTTWHWVIAVSILATLGIYLASIPFLGGYFDLGYVASIGFLWRVAVIAAIALVPPYAGKILGRTLRPPSYRKVRGV